MIIFIDWLPDNGHIQTMISDDATPAEYHAILAAWKNAQPDDILMIPSRASTDEPLHPWMYRAGRIIRITAKQEEDTP